MALLALCASSCQGAHAIEAASYFSAVFDDSEYATVTIRLEQSRAALKTINFNAPADTYELLEGDGTVQHEAERIIWQPPAAGGQMSYRVAINHSRPTSDGDRVSDAIKTADWAMLRLDDLFPSAKVRATSGASTQSYVSLSGPQGWSFETRYGPVTRTPLLLPAAPRLYNRPNGWLVAGKIGTRRETIDNRIVTVAAPTNMGFPRLDILTFLNWTLPQITRVFPEFPQRLLIAGAPRQMWRGGLSAPGSLYLHIDRPLVSENATSSLIHELTHVAGVHSAIDGGDWIVEGLAEYYSLLVLLRSGGISETRFNKALHQQASWVEREKAELKHPSSGAHTAKAVLVLHELNSELMKRGADIDRVARALVNDGEISPAKLRQVTERILGRPSATLNKYLGEED